MNPVPETDPYAELGVNSTASVAELRIAYRARARERHPDMGGTEAAMTRLNVAYQILRDPIQRAAVDKARNAGRHAPEKPHWTGAAGPPPGRPSGAVLDFGLFAGWSLGEIARRDPGYLQWLAERSEGRAYADEIERHLAPHRESRYRERRR